MENCIYIKNCVGKDERRMDIYKIRTMELDADLKLDNIANGDFDSFGKLLGDSRIISIGRFLRRYWIDELPQLYNLAKGDIKIVGIRAMDEITWKRYPSEIMQRALKQKPGLMGIDYAFAYSENFDDRIEHMYNYLNQWEEDPLGTDREFLFQIVQNIIVGGTRSC